MSKQPSVGEKAPAFHGIAIGGAYIEPTKISLEEFSGKIVVLYFYPKDDTPGCTKQACALRDGWQGISTKAVVFGVSIDSLKSHQKFLKKYDLPFALLCDEDHDLVEKFGVWVEKSMYGKTYMGTERTTFVIGADGIIKAVFPKVKPDEHLQKLLEIL